MTILQRRKWRHREISVVYPRAHGRQVVEPGALPMQTVYAGGWKPGI